jgi:hypothetical protein
MYFFIHNVGYCSVDFISCPALVLAQYGG